MNAFVRYITKNFIEPYCLPFHYSDDTGQKRWTTLGLTEALIRQLVHISQAMTFATLQFDV